MNSIEFGWFSGGYEKTKRTLFRLARKIPYVKRQVEAEVAKTARSMQESLDKDIGGMRFVTRLPQKSSSAVSRICIIIDAATM